MIAQNNSVNIPKEIDSLKIQAAVQALNNLESNAFPREEKEKFKAALPIELQNFLIEIIFDQKRNLELTKWLPDNTIREVPSLYGLVG